MVERNFNFRKIMLLVFILTTTIGCSWQFISIVQLYLNYPTSIRIMTKFDVYRDSLASITLCINSTVDHKGFNVSDLFQYYSRQKFIERIYIGGPRPDIEIKMEEMITTRHMLSIDSFCIVLLGNTFFWMS